MLDDLLKEKEMLLIIKKHPLQIGWEEKEEEFTNIRYVTDKMLKESGIQLYELVGVCDGLISDYSSIAVDYMLLDRPLGFVLTDYEIYRDKRGFVFETPLDYMPGEKIYNAVDLKCFLEHVHSGADLYKEQRKELMPVMHSRHENYCKDIIKYFTEERVEGKDE